MSDPAELYVQRLSARIRAWRAKPASERKVGVLWYDDNGGLSPVCAAIAAALDPNEICMAADYANLREIMSRCHAHVHPVREQSTWDMFVTVHLPSSFEWSLIQADAAATSSAMVLTTDIHAVTRYDSGPLYTPIVTHGDTMSNDAVTLSLSPVPVVNTTTRKDTDPELAFLTCPVCRDAAEPPWQSCTNGHLLCAPCHAGLVTPKKCPTCRAPADTLVQQRLAEAILAHFNCDLQLPCKNDGCDAVVSWNAMAAHRSVCEHQPYACPIGSISSRCMWKGRASMLDAHLANDHDCVMFGASDESILLHSDTVSGERYWYIPRLHLVAAIMSMDVGLKKNLSTRRLWFFSTTAEPVPIRLTCDHGAFSLVATLTAPPVHELDYTVRGEDYLTERRMHNNISVPVDTTGDDIVVVSVEEVVVPPAPPTETKRARDADADAENDDDAPEKKKARGDEAV